MVEIYKNSTKSFSTGWHHFEAIELDMDPAEIIDSDDANAHQSYTMKEGVYSNVLQEGFIRWGDAVATVSIGLANGVRTLSIAFKGSDDIADFIADLSPISPLKTYYARFEPLVTAIKDFLADPINDIGQVVATGHSLGGAMTQYFVSDLEESNVSQNVLGYTYGSIGAKTESTDGHQTNFAHIGDPATFLVGLSSRAREGGIVWLNAPSLGNGLGELHSSLSYEKTVGLLMAYAQDKASSFSSTNLAHKLIGDGWTTGEIRVAVGSANSDTFSLGASDFYAIGDEGDDHFNLGFVTIPDMLVDISAGKDGRTISGGKGERDTVFLAETSRNYTSSKNADGSLEIIRIDDGRLIATIESSVEYINFGGDLRKFDNSQVTASSFSGTKDVNLGEGGRYAKIGAGTGKVTSGGG